MVPPFRQSAAPEENHIGMTLSLALGRPHASLIESVYESTPTARFALRIDDGITIRDIVRAYTACGKREPRILVSGRFVSEKFAHWPYLTMSV
jgi:hypothetical protein